MSWINTVALYALAYTMLSCCVALVLGRIFRTMGPMPELDTPEIMEPRTWATPGYRLDEDGSDMNGAIPT